MASQPAFGQTLRAARRGQKVEGFNFHQFEQTGKPGGSFQTAAVKSRIPATEQRRHNSRSDSRKAASAMIAKIPFALASYIASAFKP